MKILLALILFVVPAALSADCYSGKVIQTYQDLLLNPKLFKKSCEKSELPAIEKAVEKYCILPELCKAVILTESQCNSKAKSKTGDYGLMQVNKIHGRYLDIDSNIKTGAEILESYFLIMLKKYPFNLPEALKRGLQAYNRGVAKVKKEIFKERLETEERELFYCKRNFDCYLEKEVGSGKFSSKPDK